MKFVELASRIKTARLAKGYTLERVEELAYFDAEVSHRVFNESAKEATVLCIFLGRPL